MIMRTPSIVVIVAIMLLSGLLPLRAQEYDAETFEDILETIAQESEVSPLLDAVDYFMQHPLLLRQATAKELMLIPGFSSRTARAVLTLVKNTPLLTYEDIAQELNLSPEQTELLRLCTSLEAVSIPAGAPTLLYRVRTRQRFNDVRGFEERLFEGSPFELYQRISVFTPAVEASITAEKDAGEVSVADFISGYVRSDIAGTTVLLGDYSLQSGMGSILWRQFGARKGADVLSPATTTVTSLSPYRSAIEQNFFRGIAAQRSVAIADSSSLLASLWYSSLRRAATIDTVLGITTALDADGYFRTRAEIDRRGALREQALGGLAEWNSSLLNAGVAALGLRYDRPVESNSSSAFRGTDGLLATVWASSEIAGASLAAEVSRDGRGNPGIRLGLDRRDTTVRYALAFRSFAAEFRSPFGYSFGETPRPGNETGLYGGVDIRAAASHRLLLYVDLYRTAGPTFTVPAPVRGLDLFAEDQITVSRQTQVALRLRREDKTDALTTTDGQRSVYRRIRSSVRCEIAHTLSRTLRLRLRCETALVSFERLKPTETGIIGLAYIRWRPVQYFSLSSQFALFSTPSFDSAVWAYEPSVQGMMSAPALYGDGMRAVLVAGYTPTSLLTLSVRVALTAKNQTTSLGSGSMSTAGNTERQMVFQADVTL